MFYPLVQIGLGPIWEIEYMMPTFNTNLTIAVRVLEVIHVT